MGCGVTGVVGRLLGMVGRILICGLRGTILPSLSIPDSSSSQLDGLNITLSVELALLLPLFDLLLELFDTFDSLAVLTFESL